MNRRTFIGSLAGGLLAAPLAVEAQQVGKGPRIALVLSNTPVADITGPNPTEPLVRVFLEAMRELGWIDGQNITIERMTAEGQPDRYARLAQELLNLKLNLMVVAGSGLTQAIMQATTTIPIVSAGAFGDAVVEAGGEECGSAWRESDRPDGLLDWHHLREAAGVVEGSRSRDLARRPSR